MENNGMLPIELSTIIIPFYTQALVKMGLRNDPLNGERKISLDEAKNLIDIIDFLKLKTKGNLTKDEETFISSILTQLKTEYLKQKQIIK